ncbi:hypothetical protein ASF76_12155 [Microbacterium sp. Leaf151]|nr:hypothetical protein ASF76_12155 [Microbacterium sp. Leaf151]
MPTVLNSSEALAGVSSSLATTASRPRAMLEPWSASPISESRRVSSSLCCCTASRNARTHATRSSVETAPLMRPTAVRG